MSDQKRTVGPVTQATGAAAALTTVIFYVLARYGIEAPFEVQGAVTILIVYLAGYLVKPGAGRRRADGVQV